MSTKRWMDKEAVVYIHNGILLSHKQNASESVLTGWMNPYHTEWSASEREKWMMCINADMESRKTVLMNLSAGQPRRCRQVNRPVDTVREERVRRTDRVAWRHTHTVRKTASQRDLLYHTRRSGLGALWQPGGLGGGTYAYMWLIHADVRQKPRQHCKAISLQLKISKLENWTWNNRLVPNRKRSTSRLYIVTLLI